MPHADRAEFAVVGFPQAGRGLTGRRSRGLAAAAGQRFEGRVGDGRVRAAGVVTALATNQQSYRGTHMLTNLPLHGFGQNRIWCQLVAIAAELLAWTGLLALPDHQARRWEPKRLRLRLFQTPAVLARHARHTVLHISARHAWASVIISAATALRALPAPAG